MANNNSDGCPVDHGQLAGNSGLEMLKAVNGNVKQGECPVKHTDAQSSTTATQEGCPVKHDQVKIDDRNNMPAVAEQEVWPGQQYPLGRHRVRSAIPKSDFTPTHQPGGKSKDAGCDSSACGKDKEETWVYPSEQQFYNAMKRKGWDPREEDMQVVVAIHNAVNDRAWNEIMKWESLHPECDDPRLKRFIGRPKDLSPKARLKSFIGYAPPFDRHDWYVDRCGKEVRYVIDFYRGAPPKSIFLQSSDGDSPVSMYLDARPALDNFDNVVDIARMKFTRLRTRFRTFFGSD